MGDRQTHRVYLVALVLLGLAPFVDDPVGNPHRSTRITV